MVLPRFQAQLQFLNQQEHHLFFWKIGALFVLDKLFAQLSSLWTKVTAILCKDPLPPVKNLLSQLFVIFILYSAGGDAC